jgi:hypothetical protein
VELPGVLGDGARWALVAVFALAAAEKAETLLHGAAAWHPVILAHPSWRRRAAALMAASLLADIGAVAALIVRPAWGAVAAVVLVGVYSLAGRGVHGSGGGDDCRCLWKVLRTRTRTGFLARNLALICLSVLASSSTSGGSPRAVVSGVAIFVAVGTLTRLADCAARRHLILAHATRQRGDGRGEGG